MAKLTKCPNGHFYDAERTGRCPYCGETGEAEHMPPTPPDCPGEEEFMRRLAERESAGQTGGGAAESAVDKTVPLQGEAVDKTVPLQGEAVDKTVPLQGEAVDKTVPLQGEAVDKTVPLDGVHPAPAERAGGGWRRGLLIAAAALSGLWTVLCLYVLGRWI